MQKIIQYITKNLKQKNFFFDFVLLFALELILESATMSIYHYFSAKGFNEVMWISDLRKDKLYYFFLACVFAPILEELFFRGIFDLKNLFKIVVTTSFLYIAFVSSLHLLFKNITPIQGFIVSALVLFLIISFAIYLIRQGNPLQIINSKIQKHLYPLLFISTSLFALYHIYNYQEINFQSFVATIPRFIAGCYLAYLVVKYNIYASIIMHSVHNFIVFLSNMY